MDSGDELSNTTRVQIRMRAFSVPPSRRDLATATVVEIGIATQNIRGTDRAAEYLKAQGIGLDTAIRVLSRPQQRRK
jgi:hypothetical protein